MNRIILLAVMIVMSVASVAVALDNRSERWLDFTF